MKNKIIIGSRGSKLALKYAENAKNKILENSNLNFDDIIIKEISTQGDQFQNIRLSEVGGKGLFSSNLEKELLKKKIDIAVHALKDMPSIETSGLTTNSFLKRNDPREILITKNKKKLTELKKNPIIGTSSFRREFQIKKIRSDANCQLIRGNIDTRIKKLNNGLYDAIVLACAGLKFLELENKITQFFSTSELIPSAGQGIIALQSRNDDDHINSILKKVNHHDTFKIAQAERSVLRVLEGDCETAVGVHAIIDNSKITLEAELFSLDGSKRFYEKKTTTLENAIKIGEEVGKKLKDKSNKTYKK
tara:strand:+ start:5490 stop:6407 length:918 start_codon:yes stop_codon:yes gene_type:complete